MCVCVCVWPAVCWAERPCRFVVLCNDDARMPSSLPAPQLPHKPFGYPPTHTPPPQSPAPSSSFPLSLSLCPSWPCKQSAKYFITSLLNRAETLQIAPDYLHQCKAFLMCVCVLLKCPKKNLIRWFYWPFLMLFLWSAADWWIEITLMKFASHSSLCFLY